MRVIQTVAVLGVVIRALHACSVVLITDTRYRHESSGLYGQISQLCSDRPVFKQKGGDFYLSFINDASFTGWMVTSSPCTNLGSLAAASTASHPIKVTSPWEEYDSVQEHVFDTKSWKSNANLKVTCYTTFKGCRDVVISDTRYTDAVEGTYSWQGEDDICQGKFVYRHASYSYYLYSNGGTWAVGSTRCADSWSVQVFDDAFYPEDVSASWKEIIPGSSVWTTTNMELHCKVRRASTAVTIRTTTESGRISKTTTVSSSAATVGGIIVIILVVYCCCCRTRRDRSDSTRVDMTVVNNVQMDRSTSGAANGITPGQKQPALVVPPSYLAPQPGSPYYPIDPAGGQPAPPPYYPPNPVAGYPAQSAPMPYAPQSPNGYPA